MLKCPLLINSHIGSEGKESDCSEGDEGDPGSISESGRSPGGGNGSPLQHSHLGNPMDRGPWQATVHRVAEWDAAEQLHTTGSECEFCYYIPWGLCQSLGKEGSKEGRKERSSEIIYL